jgi:DinB superfamily
MNEEGITHLRSYLASQSMRRTPAQLFEALQSVYHQFVQIVITLPDTTFRTRSNETEWSVAEVAEHVQAVFGVYEKAICTAIEWGKQPEEVSGAIEPMLRGATREELLAALETSYQRLIACVLQADPNIHLDITWDHFELGQMHWREWLLFVRIHLIEHVRQVQKLAEVMI